jgi:alkyl sulfatase BDS1-like metallo-beta-lactamase superfamily hydrolase
MTRACTGCATRARARADFAKGEYRWVAQVASQLVLAEPDNEAARSLAADASNGSAIRRNQRPGATPISMARRNCARALPRLPARPPLSPDLVSAVGIDILFDYLAIRLDPAKAAGQRWRFDWLVSDTGERAALTLEHSTLTCRLGKSAMNPDASVISTRAALDRIALRPQTLAEALADGSCKVTGGDAANLEALFAMFEDFAPMFDIVTPAARPP